PQEKAESNMQPSHPSEPGAAAPTSGERAFPITDSDGQTSNEDNNTLVASGSRRQSSIRIIDLEVRSMLKESENPEEAVRKLAKLVDDLRGRTEDLETWANKCKNTPSFPKPLKPPVLFEASGPEFELITKFCYVDQVAWYSSSDKDQGRPFMKALWTKVQVDPSAPTIGNQTPESADILEFCIHSRVMRDYLEDLAAAVIQGGKPSSDSGESRLEGHDGTISFCKPFRWLIQHHHLIEWKSKSLEEDQTCMQSHRADASSGSGKTGAATEPLNLEDDLLSQLRYLLAFMKEYLGGQLQRYEDVRAGKLKTIRFQDLWMLYKPGDLTYTPSRKQVEVFRREVPQSVITKKDELAGAWVGRNIQQKIESDDDGDEERPKIVGTGTPQAYRISAVVGGIPIEEPKKHSSRAVELYHPLRVVRYYVDFNGMRYDCVCDPITFGPYDGEKQILDLMCYPLACAPDPKKPLGLGGAASGPGAMAVLEFLNERGRSFVQVSEASHRLYEGLTVGRTKEKINTPVVIDLKLAYSTFPALQPQASLPDADGYLNVDTKHRLIHKEIIGNFSTPTKSFGAYRPYDWYQRHQQILSEKATTDLTKNLGSYPSVSLDTPDAIDKLADAMSRDDYICLLPGTVYAYALRSRKWVSLDLSLVRSADKQGSWDDLILPSDLKDMVEAVVETHIGRSQSTARVRRAAEVDIVRGKVRYIVVRTSRPMLCADDLPECVAAFTQRPLLPITCGKRWHQTRGPYGTLISTTGDIGYEPAEVERSLERLFTLAHHWGCVVLLDEADVFLAKRSVSNPVRCDARFYHYATPSSLLSASQPSRLHKIPTYVCLLVFLRILEYYQGILFLTTNRVGSFDDAFRSRLHLTLYYPKLDRRQTVAIWKVNLRRLDELNKKRLEYGEQPIEVHKDKILKFAKREWQKLSWNGRQIRNAFQTAVALAEFDAKKANNAAAAAAMKRTGDEAQQHKTTPADRPIITKKHFETIAGTSMQFDEYLYLAHGRSDESNNAKRDQVRWDYELRDSKHSQQQQHLKRLGGNRNFSSDSSSSGDPSSSDSDGDTDTGSHLSVDSSDRDNGNDTESSSNSDYDYKMKRKNQSKNSNRDKGKSKKKEGKGKEA
ncbi:hypothetical protein PG994_012853, partial [Apiospora phragmitis]